ncbi:MAG: hypothetical protein VZQ48_03710 [Candidatus Cryptobacteroides sp.]|nr:hypothetical protein [Candidatus Cryptobacteroides sp.]
MRKSFIIGISVMLAFLACTKQTQQPAVEELVLEVSMPETLTKTVLGPKAAGVYPVLWSVGDYITVNGVPSKPLTALEAGATTAVFHFSAPIKTPYHVQYGTEVPAFQQYTDGNICAFSAPMQATSYEAAFTLKHQACVLSLPLSGSVTVAGISVSAIDGTPLSSGGTVQLTMPGGGVSISSAKTFCLAVQPAVLEKGLSVDIYTTTGDRMNLVSFVDETLTAGTVYKFPATSFKANAHPVTVIADFTQLKAFAEKVAVGEKYLQARMTANIQADNTWTPLEGFTGDFDGGGYTLSGLKKAFANELQGCIRNLTVEADITIASKDDIVGKESDYWAGILTNRMYTGALVSNCVAKGSISYTQWGKELQVGAICGYAVRGTVEHCVNEAAITVTGDDGTAAVQAGGIVGRVYASKDLVHILNCRNEGTLSLDGTLKSAEVGGIVGQFQPPAASALSGCTFTGEISFESGSTLSGAMNLGGIAGSVKTASIADCSSEGTMTVNSSSSGAIRAGGILGNAQSYGEGSDIGLSGCTFSGALTIDVPSHGTLNTNAITGLYSTATHTETGCVNSGTITVL